MNGDDLDALAAQMQRLTYRMLKNYESCDHWLITPHNLTVSQGYTLLAFPQQEMIRMSELSESMDLANSTMTRMVDQLVQKELVQREPDDTDRRAILVGLTPQGQKVQNTLRIAFQEFFKSILRELEHDERVVIVETLKKLSAAIERAIVSCRSA
jgi:DNA-binding MarR family transcriptional regulator